MRQLDPLPGGNNSFATGADNKGQVVGWAESGVHDPACVAPQVLQFHPVIWGPATDQVRELPLISGDTSGAATAINNSGPGFGPRKRNRQDGGSVSGARKSRSARRCETVASAAAGTCEPSPVGRNGYPGKPLPLPIVCRRWRSGRDFLLCVIAYKRSERGCARSDAKEYNRMKN